MKKIFKIDLFLQIVLTILNLVKLMLFLHVLITLLNQTTLSIHSSSQSSGKSSNGSNGNWPRRPESRNLQRQHGRKIISCSQPSRCLSSMSIWRWVRQTFSCFCVAHYVRFGLFCVRIVPFYGQQSP